MHCQHSPAERRSHHNISDSPLFHYPYLIKLTPHRYLACNHSFTGRRHSFGIEHAYQVGNRLHLGFSRKKYGMRSKGLSYLLSAGGGTSCTLHSRICITRRHRHFLGENCSVLSKLET
ncbi:predicted protein [Sclerotinia sclerotiorum 1980 UF-70]|uniref:Uncharacterized protein n=1 Tax=Sclerotinia sclerotiorum (strain ATCC 18683 / 1980 / Ss-1) TaxID=665079 RepID=A7EI18_SCLS1|nr:predicted protein [Sclerotinia sclerotiorum 1980 UF-70]EDO02484.1 predicted protein [Sclerotinia sclerotiorum 1980 UF-70]